MAVLDFPLCITQLAAPGVTYSRSPHSHEAEQLFYGATYSFGSKNYSQYLQKHTAS